MARPVDRPGAHGGATVIGSTAIREADLAVGATQVSAVASATAAAGLFGCCHQSSCKTTNLEGNVTYRPHLQLLGILEAHCLAPARTWVFQGKGGGPRTSASHSPGDHATSRDRDFCQMFGCLLCFDPDPHIAVVTSLQETD